MKPTINFSLNKIFILFLITLLCVASFAQLKVAAQDNRAASPDEATVAPDALTQQQKFAANDGAASDGFGRGVAISGNTAVIGSPLSDVNGKADQGAAYVYVYNNGVWTPQAKLVAPDGSVNSQFGFTVAIDGETVVIGARQPSSNEKGAAYVFVRSGISWSPQAKLTASDGLVDDRFGQAVGISGNTIVVGAPNVDQTGSNSGAAYIFTRSGATWTQQARLIGSDEQAVDFFGAAVAIDADSVIVGAPDSSNVGNFNPGSAYIFKRTGTLWSQQAKLLADDGAHNDYFGGSVSISGETAAVGASGAAIGGTKNVGAVYIFNRLNASWTLQDKLSANNNTSGAFGFSLALKNDTLAVGAYGSVIDGKNQQGAGYIFKRVVNGWAQPVKLTANDGVAADLLGSTIATDGKFTIVGAPQKFVNSGNPVDTQAHGTAYLFGDVANDDTPKIIDVKVKGKKLIVTGENFQSPSFVYLNGEKQKKSANDELSPTTVVIGLKAGKLIAPGQTVSIQVKNDTTGKLSDEFIFTRPL
jgi:hypothetical protein